MADAKKDEAPGVEELAEQVALEREEPETQIGGAELAGAQLARQGTEGITAGQKPDDD
jgi:hypothetical protein